MTETEKPQKIKKHIPLIKFLLIWFAGLVFITGCMFLFILFMYIVDGSGTPLLQIPILAIFYSLPAVIAGLLLYLFYWLIWGKKQKVKWLEYAETNDKEKPRLYDKHTAVKEEQELPE